ncbi:MAG: Holliday junction branch migration protein RuvA [Candidatus Methanoperedens sp.]|jgi:Holliday junction DNA helicase RuvA|nr:Holliday junction branch migration protein RuvA [Candidatus Methanoperedens sp.]PKL53059.1 MAG: Holliday junction branch migration protein RuvA [Candidatus Methanoperedenaceae archaeon HGW-Methanoperedenaceae-1]
MISHISGEIAHLGKDFVVIDVGGIGYRVNVTQYALQELADKKGSVKLYTHLNVREDALTLYGFMNQVKLEMFYLITSVSGIGPQIAMKILSQVKVEEFAAAILHEDEKVLTRISGIGSKSAKRLILELKEKIRKKMEAYDFTVTNDITHDAVSALISLGFDRNEAVDAVQAVSEDIGELTIEALIKGALSRLREK